jgi:hypothetical protein
VRAGAVEYVPRVPRRFQIVETMLWLPPAAADPDSVRFHMDDWSANGRPVDFDDVMQRRAEVIAEWVEPDALQA